jgi:FtsP/CotA-like multicopper oxidase with cupredoxin domain
MDDHHGHHHPHHGAVAEAFPTDIEGLEKAHPPELVEVPDSGGFDLRIAPVAKQIRDDTLRMLAYNGSIPGPTFKVREGSRITVNVTNEADLADTVHWHGLRLDNRYDGTHETQEPISVGGSFTYELTFPDPGVYWYHPHMREDYGQELGLYGNIIVEPAQADYWPPAHREVALTLDDVLVEHGAVAPFGPETTYSAMGRYGNVFLIGGEADPEFQAQANEVVRFYLTNTANTRVFRIAFAGAQMKLVGGDSGRVEQETLVDAVIIAPSERVVVDVFFGESGDVAFEHRTPNKTYRLATVAVSEESAQPDLSTEFMSLRRNTEWAAERARIDEYIVAPPDKAIAFIAEMDMGTADESGGYVCPMHPDVTSDTPGSCPKCGMKLLPESLVAQQGSSHGHAHDAHHGHGHGEHGHGHHAHGGHGHTGPADPATEGIEWEDDMVDVNRITTPANMRWRIVDRTPGEQKHGIDWKFTVGERPKIRLINEMESDHPMQHPFHVHGAGRFLIVSRNGEVEPNLMWKDTVLVRTGETVDIILDVTNPGRWMAHCHIAEHHESGMMFSFDVAPRGAG